MFCFVSEVLLCDMLLLHICIKYHSKTTLVFQVILKLRCIFQLEVPTFVQGLRRDPPENIFWEGCNKILSADSSF